MKYSLSDHLVLVIRPETMAEQHVVSSMMKMKITENSSGIENATLSFDEGRRLIVSYKFRTFEQVRERLHATREYKFKVLLIGVLLFLVGVQAVLLAYLK